MRGGPDVTFEGLMPKPGLFRAWSVKLVGRIGPCPLLRNTRKTECCAMMLLTRLVTQPHHAPLPDTELRIGK